MEAAQSFVVRLWHKYERLLDQADERVSDWPLMGAYYPSFLITALYLVIVWLGPKLMKNRAPIAWRWRLFFYNIGLVAINLHILSELLTASWKLGYSYGCQAIKYSYDPDEMRVAGAIWWFYFSKMIEFMDTFFFILRKKNNQVSFLHVYHHATMFPIWWMGVKWVAGGQTFFVPMLNAFVHVIMYTYYGVAALGPEYQKYLWWKKYLTRVQLVQFVVMIAHGTQSLWRTCPYPPWLQIALIAYGFSIIFLFLNFYAHAYLRPAKKAPQDVANGYANGVGHNLPNGAVNGYKRINGVITNGSTTTSANGKQKAH